MIDYMSSLALCLLAASLFLVCIGVYRKCLDEDDESVNMWMAIAILLWIACFTLLAMKSSGN